MRPGFTRATEPSFRLTEGTGISWLHGELWGEEGGSFMAASVSYAATRWSCL